MEQNCLYSIRNGEDLEINRQANGSYRLTARVEVDSSISEAFAFFANAENLNRITPPWLRFRILTPVPINMGEGTEIDYALRLHGLPVRWKSRIQDWNPENGFTDVQMRGPYRSWKHQHRLYPTGSNGTLVEDQVEYRVPGGRLIHRLFVRLDLLSIFRYRQARVRELL